MMAILVVAVGHAAATGETADTGVRLFPGGAVVVAVRVGSGAGEPFLLDTGASRSAIDADLAQRLGLTPAGTVGVTTVAGELTASLVHLTSAAVGAASAVPITALVVPAHALDLRGPVAGLIGADVLSRRAFTIDYRRRTLTWHTALTPVAPGVQLPLTFDGSGAVVTLAAPWPGAPPLRLVADTGAAELVLYDRGPLPPHTPGPPAVVRSPAGARVVRRVVLDRLDLGTLTLRRQAALVSAPPSGDAGVAGLLPLHRFSSVTVDGPGGALIVRP